MLRRIREDETPPPSSAGDAVVMLYRDWQKPAKAEEWKRKVAVEIEFRQ